MPLSPCITAEGQKELNVELGLFPGRCAASPSPAQGPAAAVDEFVIGYAREEGAFTIWNVARYSNDPSVDRHPFLQASTPERVSRWVPRLAELTRQHAQPIRFCDEAFFRALGDWRDADTTQANFELRLRDARRHAASAWGRRSYHAVIEAFEPLRDHLTPAERLKLEYAKKHASEALPPSPPRLPAGEAALREGAHQVPRAASSGL